MKPDTKRRHWLLKVTLAVLLVVMAAGVFSIQLVDTHNEKEMTRVEGLLFRVGREYAKEHPNKHTGIGMSFDSVNSLSPVNAVMLKFEDGVAGHKPSRILAVYFIKTRFGWLHWWRQID